VGCDQLETRAARFFELRLEIGHVVMLVTKALRFTEPDAVDDRGVIQFIADDRVFVGENGFKKAAIRVERTRVKNRFLSPKKSRERGFELLVNVLGAANETDTGHSQAMIVEGFFR